MREGVYHSYIASQVFFDFFTAPDARGTILDLRADFR
jgi:hypothetical protein